MCLNGLFQDFVMSRKQGKYGIRILLCQFGAALDVGEEEGDGARGESHNPNPFNAKAVA
jgi:hypothetical protein